MSDPYNLVGEHSGVHLQPKINEPQKPEEQRDWYKVRKIARLSGHVRGRHIVVDPVQVAASILEKSQAGRIKSLFVSIVWDDGSLAVDYSNAKSSELLAHAFNVQTEVHKIVNA